MSNNIHKIWVLATSLVATAGFVHADGDSAQMRNLENRVNALEQRRGATGMINPPGRPQVRDGVDLFLFGQLLVWNAHENGLPFAIVNENSGHNLADSKVKNIHSEWDAGFRVGIGYNLPHDGWDLNLAWLRFNTDGEKKINAHSNRHVFSTRNQPREMNVFNDSCQKAHSRWDLHLNQLDLDLGREFFVSKWLTLRPHFGVRSDWVHQKWESHFRNFQGFQFINPQINTFPPNKLEIEYKDEWWGIGLEGGLDTQWGLGSGWSLFGNMTGAILYGFHDIDVEDEVSPAVTISGYFTPTSKGTFVDMDNTYRVSHPILDIMMGLRYDRMFSNDQFHLGLQLGWEHHVYFSQNQFPVFVDDVNLGTIVSNQGDLTFQGWTLSARFDF